MVAKFKSLGLSFLLRFFFKLLFLSCTLRVVDDKSLFDAKKTGKPLLVCCWHNRAILLARYFQLSPFNVWGISSTHADSEILARVLSSWNINLIRGSSTRGWFNVIKKMVAKFKVPGSIVVVTPDGPRGPAKQAKGGAFRVAKKNNVQIVACGLFVTRCWRLPSWDRTIIPKPFSKIYLKFSSSLSSGSEINTKALSFFINDNQEALEKDVC